MDEGSEVYVLVRFPSLHVVPYNVITLEHLHAYNRTADTRTNSWYEVARGAYDEMAALAQLMPDPKVLHFD